MRFAHLAFSSDGTRPLSRLRTGQPGVVVEVAEGEDGRAGKLSALGVTPGARIVVLQTFPGIVFLCDQTELAIERRVAESILVRPVEGQS